MRGTQSQRLEDIGPPADATVDANLDTACTSSGALAQRVQRRWHAVQLTATMI